MTTIFVENCVENGALVKIVERFGGYSIHRSLRPGENARLTISRYKSIEVEEVELDADEPLAARPSGAQPVSDTWPNFLQRRCG